MSCFAQHCVVWNIFLHSLHRSNANWLLLQEVATGGAKLGDVVRPRCRWRGTQCREGLRLDGAGYDRQNQAGQGGCQGDFQCGFFHMVWNVKLRAV